MAEPEHPEPSEVLTSRPTEMEASIVVAALEEVGIRSELSGEFTAGMFGTLPGWVSVLVYDEDLERAREVLERVKEENSHIDWSEVDVGEPEE